MVWLLFGLVDCNINVDQDCVNICDNLTCSKTLYVLCILNTAVHLQYISVSLYKLAY